MDFEDIITTFESSDGLSVLIKLNENNNSVSLALSSNADELKNYIVSKEVDNKADLEKLISSFNIMYNKYKEDNIKHKKEYKNKMEKLINTVQEVQASTNKYANITEEVNYITVDLDNCLVMLSYTGCIIRTNINKKGESKVTKEERIKFESDTDRLNKLIQIFNNSKKLHT